MAANDSVTMSESRYEAELTQRWLEGISLGWTQAAAALRKRSGEAYEKKRDEEASLLRRLAEWLAENGSQEAQKRAAEHSKIYLSEDSNG